MDERVVHLTVVEWRPLVATLEGQLNWPRWSLFRNCDLCPQLFAGFDSWNFGMLRDKEQDAGPQKANIAARVVRESVWAHNTQPGLLVCGVSYKSSLFNLQLH